LTLFDLQWKKTQSRASKQKWLSLRIFIEPSVEILQKSVYSVFDFLRDLGGVASIFILMSQMATHLLTY